VTNHFFVIDPQGIAHTRSSKGRTYTHTVVFVRGQAHADRKLAEALEFSAKQAPKDFEFYTSLIDGSWQAASALRHPTLYADADYAAKQLAQDKARGEQEIGGLDVAGYVAKRHERALARHAEMIADGYYNTFHNAGWCGRPDLANKLAAQTAGEQVIILEAQVGKPPKA
jgi:hypothetical protein